MIDITEHADGCIVPVRAQPGARRNGVVGEQAGALKLAVTAPPEDGKANKAIVQLLAEVLRVKKSQVELVSGQTSRSKKFLLHGITASDVRARLGF